MRCEEGGSCRIPESHLCLGEVCSEVSIWFERSGEAYRGFSGQAHLRRLSKSGS